MGVSCVPYPLKNILMPIHLICVGQRMPAWVTQGVAEYSKRLPRPWDMHIHEIPVSKRGHNADIERCCADEGRKMLAALPRSAWVTALDEHGHLWDSLTLSRHLHTWLQQGTPLAFFIGGPDGLAPACLQRANALWSLSPLTLPHALVRVLVAEQFYRAWSVAHQHPYHRP
jgi:23S rRNA (pseudouridine1915-N3)-methyltransferase